MSRSRLERPSLRQRQRLRPSYAKSRANRRGTPAENLRHAMALSDFRQRTEPHRRHQPPRSNQAFLQPAALQVEWRAGGYEDPVSLLLRVESPDPMAGSKPTSLGHTGDGTGRLWRDLAISSICSCTSPRGFDLAQVGNWRSSRFSRRERMIGRSTGSTEPQPLERNGGTLANGKSA